IGLSVALSRPLGLVGIALTMIIASGMSLAVQAACLLRLCGVDLLEPRVLRGAARCLAAGCAPVVLGILALAALKPIGWWRSGLFAAGYLLVGSLALVLIEDQMRGWAIRCICLIYGALRRSTLLAPAGGMTGE